MIKHFSLIILIMGAGALFVSNIFFKNILTPLDYGHYSIVITFFSLIYLFGALGSEQVILRYSKYSSSGRLIVDKKHLSFIFFIILLVTITSTHVFEKYLNDIKLNTFLLGISSFALVLMMILSTLLRLNKNFVYSQFTSNFWKIALLAISVYMFSYSKSEFGHLFQFVCYSIILTFITTTILFFRVVRIDFSEEINTFFVPFIHYFIAIMSFTVMTFADRFLIESKFDLETFGDYFFISTFFLAPFSILQNYIGFKQLVAFKLNFNLTSFKSQNLKAIYLGLLLGIVLFILVYVIQSYEVFHFNSLNSLLLSILLIFTGVIRIYSSSVTSGFEAIVNVETLKKSNYIIISATCIILLITFKYAESIEAIVFSMMLTWLVRTWILKILIINQFNKKVSYEP